MRVRRKAGGGDAINVALGFGLLQPTENLKRQRTQVYLGAF